MGEEKMNLDLIFIILAFFLAIGLLIIYVMMELNLLVCLVMK